MTWHPVADEMIAGKFPEAPTLRDRFAMAALTGLLVVRREDYKCLCRREEVISKEAFAVADAMLLARRPAGEAKQ